MDKRGGDILPTLFECYSDEDATWIYSLFDASSGSTASGRRFSSGCARRVHSSRYDKSAAICLKAADGEPPLSVKYKPGKTILHVGLSDSAGARVYHIDQDGVASVPSEQWGVTLVIPVRGVTIDLQQRWDQLLKLFFLKKVKQERKQQRRNRKKGIKTTEGLYHQATYNCFHFVAEFLGVTRSHLISNCIAVRLGELERYHIVWGLLRRGKQSSVAIDSDRPDASVTLTSVLRCFGRRCSAEPSRFCLQCEARFCKRCALTLAKVDFGDHQATHSLLRDIWSKSDY